jgi:hypothetical protein
VATPLTGQTRALHDIGCVVQRQTPELGPQAGGVLFIEAVIGVHPEDPVAGSMAQAFITGGGEAIHPGKVNDLGTETGSDLAGAVAGAGVHNSNLIH